VKVGICLFCQVWSWLAWSSAQVFLLEYHDYKSVGYSILPKWTYLPLDSPLSRIEGVISGLLFGFLGIHLNLLFTNPENLLRDVNLAYLGVCFNVLAFGFVMSEIYRRQPLPCPGKYQLMSFLRYTMRRSMRNRIFAGVTAFLMTFGTWLFPWCCVR